MPIRVRAFSEGIQEKSSSNSHILSLGLLGECRVGALLLGRDETGVCRMFSIKVVIRYLDQAPGSEGWILNSKYEGIYGVMVTEEAPGWRGDLSCVAWDYELFSGGMVSRWGTRGRDPW